MKPRKFFVALGVPRGSDPEMVHVAYRKVVSRYRHELDSTSVKPLDASWVDESLTRQPRFTVLRPYSERRHSRLFEDLPSPESHDRSEIDRYYGGYVPDALNLPKARRSGKDLFVELRVSSEESKRGGLFSVHIPVIRRCPVCEGAPEVSVMCHCCEGTCQITEDRMVDLTTPPGLEHGQTARIPMEDVGLNKTDLVVFIQVSGTPRG